MICSAAAAEGNSRRRRRASSRSALLHSLLFECGVTRNRDGFELFFNQAKIKLYFFFGKILEIQMQENQNLKNTVSSYCTCFIDLKPL